MIKIAPSILTADFAELGEEIRRIERGGSDWVHVDIMDNNFVPNMSMGPCVVKSLRPVTTMPLDVHLMIENADQMIPPFAKAGADYITVHYEACAELKKTLDLIHSFGIKTGVSVKPKTPVEVLFPYMDDIDLILIMSVEPGFGGQSFMECSLEKLASARKEIAKYDKNIDLEVDGGVNFKTWQLAVDAGADVLVMGSCIYDGKDPEENLRRIKREIAEKKY